MKKLKNFSNKVHNNKMVCDGNESVTQCRWGGADKNVWKSSWCMLDWWEKNYRHGQGKTGTLMFHNEWEPCL